MLEQPMRNRRLTEGVDERFQRGREELEGVAEDNVRPPLDLEVLLCVLGDDADWVVGEFGVGEGPCDEMGVVSPEIMEKHGDFVRLAPLQVAEGVRGPEIQPCEVVVVEGLLQHRVAEDEGLVAEVAYQRGLVFGRDNAGEVDVARYLELAERLPPSKLGQKEFRRVLSDPVVVDCVGQIACLWVQEARCSVRR